MEDTDMIKIAEKVKFWEKQDEINKELIPRVIKNHKLITKISQRSLKSAEIISNIKAQNNKLETDYKSLAKRINKLDNLFKENEEALNNSNEFLENSKNIEKKTEAIYNEWKKSKGELRKLTKLVYIFITISLVMSVVAVYGIIN
ncbi:MAG: hypothetical protein FH751_12585 [Firmicutes bacterium]|nr:hypothetical protein [Bacillota bacterium]